MPCLRGGGQRNAPPRREGRKKSRWMGARQQQATTAGKEMRLKWEVWEKCRNHQGGGRRWRRERVGQATSS